MIEHTLDTNHSILYVRPRAALEKSDFEQLANTADPFISETGDLAGLVIDAPDFPGWENLGAIVAHFRFIRDHQKHIRKIALVTDSAVGNVAEHLASHFVSAEIQQFPAGQAEAATQWILGRNTGTCYNSIEIASPINTVWATIKGFHDASWAPGVVTSLEKIGGKAGDEPGAKRVLNGVFHETLTVFDPEKHTFSYSIDDGPGPVASDAVSNYTGVVKLSEIENGCLVEWSSTFSSANEDEVADFCNPIYQALLHALKESLS